MKLKSFAMLLLVLLSMPFTALAASKNSETVSFPYAVTLGGTQVPAGTYKVEWDGTGTATVTINRGKKVVATVPATVTQTKSHYDGALHFQDDTLQAIYWKNTTIQFNTTAAPSNGN